MKKTSDYVQLLKGVELFRGCSRRELAAIATITTPTDKSEGTVLCTEGSPGLQAFVIVDGKASVSIAGREIAVLGPGSFFGELALLDGGPRVATVTATTPLSLLVLNRREFWSLLETSPGVARRMLEALGSRLREAERPTELVPAGA